MLKFHCIYKLFFEFKVFIKKNLKILYFVNIIKIRLNKTLNNNLKNFSLDFLF